MLKLLEITCFKKMDENCTPSVITFASNSAPKIETYALPQDGKVIYVWDAPLIRVLTQVLRVPYKVFIPPDSEWGRLLPDGNWTGIIGMVKRSEVDMGVGAIDLDERRFKAVDFSYPFLISEFVFMTDKPVPLRTSLVLLYPFSFITWILILLSIFSVTFCVLILTSRKKRFYDALLKIIGSLYGQPISFNVQKTKLKLFLCTWFFFIFIITRSYTGVYLSFLSFPPQVGIRNIRDLSSAAEENKVTCYTKKGSPLFQALLYSDIEPYKTIGNCLLRNIKAFGQPKDVFVNAPPKKAFIGGKIILLGFEKDFFFSEDSFFNVMFAFPISKKFCHKIDLDYFVHRIVETGLVSKEIKVHRMVFEARKPLNYNNTDSGALKKLEMSDLKGAFLLLIIGYILASITLFIEITVNFFGGKNFVSVYHESEICIKIQELCTR